MEIKDATELRRGDRIVLRGSRVDTVTASTTRERHNTCTIHTATADTLTTLPCPVKVVTS